MTCQPAIAILNRAIPKADLMQEVEAARPSPQRQEPIPPPRGSAAFSLAMAATAASLVVVVAGLFARRQSLWIDETTQLNGIAMGPAKALAWLIGDPANLHGVPPDRAPPLSYLAGQLWSATFGFHPQTLRWMGIIAAALAAAALCFFSVRRMGWRAGALVVAGFAAFPALAVTAAEIRPYPLLVLFATTAWLCFVAIVARGERASRLLWAGLLTACLLASYTHFFGLLMTFGLFASLLVDAWIRRAAGWKKRLGPIVVSAGLLAVLGLGLSPFVRHAMGISHGGPGASGGNVLGHAGRLVVRLFASPSVIVEPVAVALVFAGYGVLIGAAFFRNPDRPVARAIALAFALPLFVCTLLALIAPGFDALAPHYNIWIVPGISLLAAMGAWSLARVRPTLATMAVVAILAANVVGCAHLLSGDHFTHGPHNAVVALLGSKAKDTAIVADDGSAWAFLYFPIRYDLGENPPFFVATGADGQEARRIEPEQKVSFEEIARYPRVLVLRATELRTRELARDLKGQPITLPASELGERFAGNPQWRQVGSLRHISFVATTGGLFERVAPSD